jgi:hypothetical protein
MLALVQIVLTIQSHGLTLGVKVIPEISEAIRLRVVPALHAHLAVLVVDVIKISLVLTKKE